MLFHNMLVKIHLQIIWLAKQDTSIKNFFTTFTVHICIHKSTCLTLHSQDHLHTQHCVHKNTFTLNTAFTRPPSQSITAFTRPSSRSSTAVTGPPSQSTSASTTPPSQPSSAFTRPHSHSALHSQVPDHSLALFSKPSATEQIHTNQFMHSKIKCMW